jgi:hypothetical protein
MSCKQKNKHSVREEMFCILYSCIDTSKVTNEPNKRKFAQETVNVETSKIHQKPVRYKLHQNMISV